VGFYSARDLGVFFGVTWAGSGRLAPPPAALTEAPSDPGSAADWSGVYAGAQGGGGLGRSHWDADAFIWTDAPSVGLARPFDMAPRGGLFGGQLGARVQQGRWVFGLEASAARADIARTLDSPYFPGEQTETTRISALDTLTGRLGYARGDWLAYVDGGYARARMATLFRDIPAAVTGGGAQWHAGLVAGLGIERRVTEAVSLALEYDRLSLARASLFAADSNGVTGVLVVSRARFDGLFLRVNFRLNGLAGLGRARHNGPARLE